jgi:hypothetical protein
MFSTPAVGCEKEFRGAADGELTKFSEDFVTVRRGVREIPSLACPAV